MDRRLNRFKYPGARRLMLEALELKDKTEDYYARPIDDNLFEWHFTVRGPPGTAFQGGFYHGRLSFPTEYPMKPPSIILLNPNGRFETNKKICLSISAYHPETWQPSWSVRTALLALIAFMPTDTHRAMGSLDYPDPERRKLAKHSQTWSCDTCGPIKDLLIQPKETNATNSGHDCEASTSRVNGEIENLSADLGQDRNSHPRDGNDSDGEARDSSKDSQESSRSSDISDIDGMSTSSLDQKKQTDSEQGEDAAVGEGRNVENNQSDISQQDGEEPPTFEVLEPSNKLGSSSSSVEPSSNSRNEERRACPSIVFISISILLFLLILRRIVIIIQS